MSKIFNSTSKHFGEKNKGHLDKPSGKKIRPNSAQNISSDKQINKYESTVEQNDDFNSPIKTINELPEEPNYGKFSLNLDEPNSGKKVLAQRKSRYEELKIQPSNNDENLLNSKLLEPVYQTRERQENNQNFDFKGVKPNGSALRKKRLSKSKDRKSKMTKEVSEPKLIPSRMNLIRPFSGGVQKSSKIIKQGLKPNKVKIRPSTAKISEKKEEPDFKNLNSNQVASPKTAKKNQKRSRTKQIKYPKSSKKSSTSKNLRKSSLSPNNEKNKFLLNNKNLKQQKMNGAKLKFGNRRSMNDLHDISNKPEKVINVLTNNFVKINYQQKLVVIQKFLRGYKEFRMVQKLKEKSKKTESSGYRKSRVSNELEINRLNSSSSNTLERASNQNDILKAMILENTKNQYSNDNSASEEAREVPEKVRAEINISINSKLKLINKEVRKRVMHLKDDVCSKSTTNFDVAKEKTQTDQMEIVNKSLKSLKKKRINSAKNKVENVANDDKTDRDTNVKLHEIFEKINSIHIKKSKKRIKKDEAIEENTLSKPPISGRSARNEPSSSKQKSYDSMSEQMSPSNGSQTPFSTEKYQQMLKNQIQSDFANK